MKADLLFTDATPEDGKKYKRNSESETNSPYIVVGTYESVCPSNTFAGLPDTPSLAGAYEHGLLDGNLGQMASFQSTYKSTLRIEVPVWPEVRQAALPTAQVKCHPGRRGATSPAPPDRNHKQGVAPSLHGQDNATGESPGAGNAEEEAEEVAGKQLTKISEKSTSAHQKAYLQALDMPSRGLGIATSSNKPALPRTDLACQVSISGV